MKKPQHIAVICDGNRTWARKRGKPAGYGHQKGIKKVEELIRAGLEFNIPYLTFWIFSTENWKRSEKEVGFLFNLFRNSFKSIEKKINDEGVRMNFIGDISKLPPDMQQIIKRSQNTTKNNQKLTATFAINYGGRDEIIRAINKFITTHPQKLITAEKLANQLDTHDLPDPDLIVRTGLSNYRLSGFMLWQMEYAELYFPKVNFPDFGKHELKKAIEEFGRRQRRFGK